MRNKWYGRRAPAGRTPLAVIDGRSDYRKVIGPG
jgi:hypothetical protein